jgi:outer membrane protein OmpA-like peptidoglycan-associated protein
MNMTGKITEWLVCVGLVGGLMVSTAHTSRAQVPPSASDIVDALKPKPPAGGLTRSLTGPAGNPEDRRFIDGLRSKQTRSITIEERTKAAEIAKAKPGIDLEITFDFDSAIVGPKAMPTLVALGTALLNPDLKGQAFLVGGHTDAKGGDAYNQALSERRAEAVKRFLVEKFSLPAENLIGIGYGKEQLKNTANPFADENRRVQVVNMSAQ